MASYKEILQAQMDKFRDLKEQEKAELNTLEGLSINWSTLDRARADIKANFEMRRKELREDPKFKAALAMKSLQKVFDSDEMIEEAKPYQIQEEPKPEENEDEGIGIVCPNCGEKNHEPTATYCHICGTDLRTGKTIEQQEKEEKEEQEKKSKKRRRKNRWNKNRKREW